MTCTHENCIEATGYHIYQKGEREYICLYGTHRVCKDCGLVGTIQNGGFTVKEPPKGVENVKKEPKQKKKRNGQ